jgi:hypothetical protein
VDAKAERSMPVHLTIDDDLGCPVKLSRIPVRGRE